MRGNVFRIAFRILAREFESIENPPGFACLIRENWMLHRSQYKTAVPWTFFVKPQLLYVDFQHLTIFFKHHEYCWSRWTKSKENEKPVNLQNTWRLEKSIDNCVTAILLCGASTDYSFWDRLHIFDRENFSWSIQSENWGSIK